MIRRRVALIEQRGAIALVPCKRCVDLSLVCKQWGPDTKCGRCVKVGRKCTLYRPYYTPWFAEESNSVADFHMIESDQSTVDSDVSVSSSCLVGVRADDGV